MLITITQRGGFAGGETTVARVETAGLAESTRAEVERQVHKLFAATAPEPGIGADLPEYEITVQDGATQRVLRWTDDATSASDPVRELVAHLSNVR